MDVLPSRSSVLLVRLPTDLPTDSPHWPPHWPPTDPTDLPTDPTDPPTDPPPPPSDFPSEFDLQFLIVLIPTSSCLFSFSWPKLIPVSGRLWTNLASLQLFFGIRCLEFCLSCSLWGPCLWGWWFWWGMDFLVLSSCLYFCYKIWTSGVRILVVF